MYCACRKLAKSALVLIPLFGVPYIVFLGVHEPFMNERTELVKLYFEMTFNSFNVSSAVTCNT
jgi:7 transmembrane receptor (Secretin family)